MDNKRVHGKRKRITVSKFNHLRTYTSVNAKYNAIEQPKLSEVPTLSELLEQVKSGTIQTAKPILPQKIIVSLETAITENIDVFQRLAKK